MPRKVSDFWRGYVTALSDEKYSRSQIVATCKLHGLEISKAGIFYVLRRNESETAEKFVPVSTVKQHAPSRPPELVEKVRKLMNVEKPPTQRAIARLIGVPLTTVNAIIRKDLGLKQQRIKYDVNSKELAGSVQARPALYDPSLKEHQNKDIIANLWDEVAEEVQSTAAECRMKWDGIKQYYIKYLKKRRKPSRIKKSWYLADAVDFLKDFVEVKPPPVKRKRSKENDGGGENIVDQSGTFSSNDDSSSKSSLKRKQSTKSELIY